MSFIRDCLRRGHTRIEAAISRVCGTDFNPLVHLGALGFFCFWIVAVTGVYLYVVFDTSVLGAFRSVEYLTNEQWYLGGVMRSLHRYASDALVAFMFLHMLREFTLNRFRGPRAFSWITGVPVIWLVYASGISGYWLVWDALAQFVAITTTELMDWLPFFGTSIARNFLTPDALDDRFFTLLIFMHIFLPLFLLFVLWIHIQRISKPKVNPPKRMAITMLVTFLALSFAAPATSHSMADLSNATGLLKIDWYYLGLYPLIDKAPAGFVWAGAVGFTLFMSGLPFIGQRQSREIAQVSLENCNGCELCLYDCPYSAISMVPRTDGKPFARQAHVAANLCVGCGICAGACPTSTPFRSGENFVPGIELENHTLKKLRDELESKTALLQHRPRIVVFGCIHADTINAGCLDDVARISLQCAAMLPPSFIDYVLAKNLADGVVINGCRIDRCFNRTGAQIMEMRLNRERDPRLRRRVGPDQLATSWAGESGAVDLTKTVSDLATRIRLNETSASENKAHAKSNREPTGESV